MKSPHVEPISQKKKKAGDVVINWKCDICFECTAKYRCPRCGVESCSLKCVKQHKADTNCSGIRDKTKYVDLKKFNDSHLLSDYRFLEETGRKVDSTSRDDLKRKRGQPNFLKELHRQAKKRKIVLRVMPYPMEKRKHNFTTFHIKSQTILWQIKWMFPKCDSTYTDTRISENSILKDLLKKYIDPTESDPVCRQKLKDYNNTGLDSCNVYMKAEGHPANSPRYHKLDKEKSILENLTDVTVVEYPVIYIDYCDQDQYTLIERG